MITVTEVKSIDFEGKAFVLDNSLLLFKCGNKLLSREDWEGLGRPRYDGYIEEFDEAHPLVKSIIEAGGVVRRNISGKTDFYVVKESQQSGGAKARDYQTQLGKGKPIIAISDVNLKMLLGTDESSENESENKVQYADKYEMIELYDPSNDKPVIIGDNNIYVDEIDISGEACSDWEYKIDDNNTTVYLSDYLGNAESITLPTTIEGKRAELRWASGAKGCRFKECKAKKVYVPGKYREVPPTFFQENLYLEEIVLGKGIEEIGFNFCAGAENLEKVTFPDTIKNVGFNCLILTKWASEQGDESVLGSVLIHKGEGSGYEPTYSVPEGIQCIAEWTFIFDEDENSDIKRLELPASMKYISEQAFRSMKLTTMKVPSTLEYIGTRAFLGTDIEHLYRCKKHEPMLIIRNILCAIYAENCGEELHIPEGVEIITDEAMQYLVGGSTLLEHVILPDSMKELGCRIKWGMKQISVNSGLKRIGAGCFDGCTRLEKIDLPYGLEELGDHAFARSGLKHITIPGNVKTIKKYTFYDCENLEEATICEGIERIEDSAFEGCKSLTSVKLPSTIKCIGYKAFADCNSLKTITIPSSVDIGYEAFAGCGEIEIIKEYR